MTLAIKVKQDCGWEQISRRGMIMRIVPKGVKAATNIAVLDFLA